jgi:DNA polymerase-4
MTGLRYLFVDMNSFFASVEQDVDPSLRGQPVAVVPVATVHTSCIAASVEAKQFGIKTGTRVSDAMALCPNLQIRIANTRRYVAYHQKIVEAVESCLHVDHVASIDEMYGRLMGLEQLPDNAAALAHRVKQAIRDHAGESLRCSIGIGPSPWLAKVASDLEKPDGLTMIQPHQMPEAICHLELRDLPGIGRNMEKRLRCAGIYTVEQLCRASQSDLAEVWGSRVLGTIWWEQLRGKDLPFRATHRRTVGHSHVLAPEWRVHEKAKAVAMRMLHKAAMRMRRIGYCARELSLGVSYVDGRRWRARVGLNQTRDTLSLVRAMEPLWNASPVAMVLKVGVTLNDLVPDTSATIPLYPQQANLEKLAGVLDRIDSRYGQHTIYLGGMWGANAEAPSRIAFTQIPDAADIEMEDIEVTEDA